MSEGLAAGLLHLAGWPQLVDAVWSGEEAAYFARAEENPGKRGEGEGRTEAARKIPARVKLSPYFLDPMCGAGTLAIEAALMLLGRKPNARRASFGFHALKAFEGHGGLLDAIGRRVLGGEHGLADAIDACARYADRAAISSAGEASGAFDFIRAGDVNPRAVENARANAQAAGVGRLIRFFVADAAKARPHADCGLLVTNPPYGERLGADDDSLKGLYKGLGDTFKQRFSQWTAWVLSANMDAVKAIGLRATRKPTVFNGNLECRFLQYVMYASPKD